MPGPRSSGLDFSDGKVPSLEQHPDMDTQGAVPKSFLQRNKTERRRLQGLQRSNTTTSTTVTPYVPRTFREKWDRWMINEGGRRIFFFVWVFLHLLVAALGTLHYGLKDNLTTARATFGVTFSKWKASCNVDLRTMIVPHFTAIARAAALVLHVDVIFILLPVCRNFISLVRRTPLNHYIPFDKNITFHKATAWSIVVGTVVHVVAHMVNFAELALSDKNANAGGKFVAFLTTNFTTGPGVTGWIMTVALFIMVWFAIEKRRRANFEAFWYTHHLFIVFFINWQLHGMFCMIKPDRPPYCSYNTIGVFWVSPRPRVWVGSRHSHGIA